MDTAVMLQQKLDAAGKCLSVASCPAEGPVENSMATTAGVYSRDELNAAVRLLELTRSSQNSPKEGDMEAASILLSMKHARWE